MRTTAARIPGGFAVIAVTALSLAMAGCGGGSYSASTQPPPQPTPGSSSGGWEIFFQSGLNPTEFIVLEANLSQTDKHLFSAANGALIFHAQGSQPYQPVLTVSYLGGECYSGGADDIAFDGTLANPSSGNQAATFTLTENSTLGSVVLTASASIDAKGAMSGAYTLPAACGFPKDHGTISGYKPSTQFSIVDLYQGTIDGSPVVLWFDGNGVVAAAGGTYNGATVALNGFGGGNALTLTGTISGQETTWFVLYDSLYNTFRIYDSDANLIGSLTESP